MQLCAIFRSTKVNNNTDTTLDGVALLLSTEYFDSQSLSSHRVLFINVVQLSVVLDILAKLVEFLKGLRLISLSKSRVLLNLIFLLLVFLQYLLTCLCKLFNSLSAFLLS